MKTAILAAIVAILIAAMQFGPDIINYGNSTINKSAKEYTANPSEIIITNNNNIDVNTNNKQTLVVSEDDK